MDGELLLPTAAESTKWVAEEERLLVVARAGKSASFSVGSGLAGGGLGSAGLVAVSGGGPTVLRGLRGADSR